MLAYDNHCRKEPIVHYRVTKSMYGMSFAALFLAITCYLA